MESSRGCADVDNEDKGRVGICILVQRDDNELLFLLWLYSEGGGIGNEEFGSKVLWTERMC